MMTIQKITYNVICLYNHCTLTLTLLECTSKTNKTINDCIHMQRLLCLLHNKWTPIVRYITYFLHNKNYLDEILSTFLICYFTGI